MKKDQLIRLRFIDSVLTEYRLFNRSLLVDTFGVSEITATRDLRAYKDLNPKLTYSTTSKNFTVPDNFREVKELWMTAQADSTSFLKSIEMIYDVKIGTQPVPVFGVHKA